MSTPFLAACDKCNYTKPCTTQRQAVNAIRAHQCTTKAPKPYVPARERTPWGQFQLRPTHLKTSRPGAEKFGPQDRPEQATRVELPPAQPTPKPVVMLGPCISCGRTIQAKNGAPRQPGTVAPHTKDICNSCEMRRRRGLDGPSRPKGGPSLTGMGLPPADVLDQALCAQTDPEAFFPEKGGSTREAKAVCAACPVREACLAWAIKTNQPHGVWGGLSEKERRKLRSRDVAA